jgi:hypothetical protein
MKKYFREDTSHLQDWNVEKGLAVFIDRHLEGSAQGYPELDIGQIISA